MNRKQKVRRLSTQIGLLMAAMILLIIAVAAAPAQSPDGPYFPETGHTISSRFLAFFRTRGGLEIFGYPITDEFVINGMPVQYFQRARFEWHPGNPPAYQVQLGLLGDELGYGQQRLAADQVPNNPYCRYFPETGHTVCNAFLSYFREHGGLDIFGYPISEFYIKNKDRIVQDFQRARMEWHPEKPATQKVQLTQLGLLDFDVLKLDRGLLTPRLPGGAGIPANTPITVTQINARASVLSPITGRAGSQTVYVVVQDQFNKPVKDAEVSITIHFVSGDQTPAPVRTNASGITKHNIPFGQTKPGNYVFIDVKVNYQGLTAETRTSFLPWW